MECTAHFVQIYYWQLTLTGIDLLVEFPQERANSCHMELVLSLKIAYALKSGKKAIEDC